MRNPAKLSNILGERDKKGAYANNLQELHLYNFQEIFAYEYRHLSGSFNYFCTLKHEH